MRPWLRVSIAAPVLAVALLLGVPPGVSGTAAVLPSQPPPTSAWGGGGQGWTLISYREPGIGLGVGASALPAATPPLSITLTLPFSHPSQLGALLGVLDQPSSPSYRHYLTAAEFDVEFGGSPELYTAWSEYALGLGATHLATYGDRATLTFGATPEVAGALFHTSILLYHDDLGRPFYAPATPPEIPRALWASGAYVDGLSSYSRYVIGTDAAAHAVHPTLRPLTHPAPTVLGYPIPVTLAGVQEQFASDYQVAYDQLSLYQEYGYPTDAVAATILWSGNYTGTPVTTPYGTLTTNQAVGAFNPSDISAFYNETLPAGEPHPTVYGAPLNGAPPPGPLASWDGTNAVFENTLDLEDLGALAPGATIYNVYAPWPSNAGLDQAFAYVLSPNSTTPALSNVSVISNSWGSSESNDSGWYQDLEESQARGITVLAISGDSGDSPTSSWSVGNAFFPGSMAYNTFGDVAVGGTTNRLSTSTLALLQQRAWYDGNQAGGPVGSTGGISAVFSEPTWQSTTSADGVLHGAGRGVPDVAALANNSLMTYTVDGYQYQATNASVSAPYYYSWGTSIATPVEAGVIADIDHVLQHAGNGWLGFLDPTLYPLASEEDAPLIGNSTVGFYYGPSYTSILPTLPVTDVKLGANHQYSAAAGYDLVTGWGALDAYNLTMYYLALPTTAAPGRWSGVRASMDLAGLEVNSSYPGYGINTAFNASFQQNFFVANSLGAPIYWVQNVVYVYGVPGNWQMNFTGWLVYPFYGIEGSLTMYEYDFPLTGGTEVPPVNFTFQTRLLPGTGFNDQRIEFSFGTPGADPVTLPAPGASFIIGNLSYNYSWMGVEYSNGPFPAPYGAPGGLDPQFGLVGGPSGYIGNYGPQTDGTVQLSFSFGGLYISGLTQAFGGAIGCGSCIDQTGEQAANLTWSETSPGNVSAGIPATWAFSYLKGGEEQGILESEPATLPSTSNVTVHEQGLPNGSAWGITFVGAGQYSGVAPGSLVVPLFNGTYTYHADPPAGYSAAPGTGTVNVTGTGPDPVVDLTFVLTLYNVTIRPFGLLPGSVWWFNITGNDVGPLNGVQSASLQLTRGSYPYNVSAGPIWVARPSHGVLVVSGASTSLDISFAMVPAYSVTFESVGLSNGGWTVTVDGRNSTDSQSNPLQFDLPNGTYAWSASAVLAAFYAVPDNGTVMVAGAPVVQQVMFQPVTFNVTFVAAGLPAGTLWSLTAAGTSFPATDAAHPIVARLDVGLDVYDASSKDPAYGGALGVVPVTGPGQVVTVQFSQVEFLVVFSELGLPSGLSWGVSVGVNGTPAPVNAGANDSFLLDNGSYPYHVAVPPGYTATPQDGTLHVDGANQTVPIHVAAAPPGGSAVGPFSWEELFVIALVAAAAILSVLLVVTFRRRTRPPPEPSAGRR